MSKTIDLQVEKSATLIKGLRKNLSQLTGKGIAADQLDVMEADLEKLKKANEECDKMRAELSVKVKAMNAILASVKDEFAEKKKVIKGYYPQEQWFNFGVLDKR